VSAFTFKFYSRDFNYVREVPGVELVVEWYSWHEEGGPFRAELSANGFEDDIWQLVEHLRAPVEIFNENGDSVWWGYLHEIGIQRDAIKDVISLDEMYNRVGVLYTLSAPGSTSIGGSAATAWAENTDSSERYGTRELLIALSAGNAAQADNQRDIWLDFKKYPQVVTTVAEGQGGAKEAPIQATITCYGWFETLDWVYLARDAGIEENDNSDATQNVGQASGNTKVSQAFVLSGTEGFNAKDLTVKLGKVGSPADNVRLALHSDSGGSPGSELSGVNVAGSAIPDGSEWVTGSLTAEVALALATTYHLVVSRTGGTDSSNYYELGVDEDLSYSGGVLKLYNGASWGSRTPNADMAFKVGGVEETTTQIANAILLAAEFIVETEIDDASGIKTNQWRSGEERLLAVIREIMASGVSGGRRLLATVTRNRVLRLYQEPTADAYRLDRNGDIASLYGAPVEKSYCPVGVWLERNDIPRSARTALLTDMSRLFVQEAEYHPATDRYVPTPRGGHNPWTLPMLGTG